MTREEEILIEKVIWLIEDSYPDTDDWGHDALLVGIKESLKTRTDELNQMFGDSEIPTITWHKVADGDLPNDGQHILMAREAITYKGLFIKAIFYSTSEVGDDMKYWMDIPEIPTED